MSNISFGYRYRDADNFKAFNTVTFSNPGNVSIEVVGKILSASLGHLGLWPDVLQFRPEWVRLPPLFLFLSEYERTLSDHDWHEIDEVAETEEQADDVHGRTIEELLRDISRTHQLNRRVMPASVVPRNHQSPRESV